MKIFHSTNSRYKEPIKVLLINALILFFVIFYDIYNFNAGLTFSFFAIKFFFIITPFFGVLLLKYKKTRDWSSPFILITLFSYSYYYMTTLHYTYYTSFFQYFMAGTVALHFKKIPFYVTHITGLILFIYAVKQIPNPNFQEEVILPTVLIWIFCIWWFQTIIHEKNVAKEKDKIFTELGKVSSFLLHELNSPIARLKNGISTGNNIQNEIEKISNILQLTKTFIKSDININNDHIYPQRIIKNNLDTYTKTIEKAEININLDIQQESFQGPKTFLEIIIKNLIANAIEHLILNQVNSPTILIKGKQESNTYHLSFTNNTILLKKSALKNFFEPWFSTKMENSSNQGLGLFLSKKIAEAIKVKLSVSYKNQLITFNLYIPL